MFCSSGGRGGGGLWTSGLKLGLLLPLEADAVVAVAAGVGLQVALVLLVSRVKGAGVRHVRRHLQGRPSSRQ